MFPLEKFNCSIAEDEIAQTNSGGAKTEQGKEPPRVSDNAIEDTTNESFEQSVWVRLGLITRGKLDEWYRRRGAFAWG